MSLSQALNQFAQNLGRYLSPSIAMTRHQPWFVYVPSAITVWCFTLHGGMAGRMFRRHAVRLRRALESSFAPHADREARRAACRVPRPVGA